MRVRGSSVNVLAQGKEEHPISALTRLGVSIECRAPPAQHETVESTRQRLLHCLSQARQAPRQGERRARLRALLSDGLREGLARGRGSRRNRELFFMCVLAADPAANLPLREAGVVDMLCEAVAATIYGRSIAAKLLLAAPMCLRCCLQGD